MLHRTTLIAIYILFALVIQPVGAVEMHDLIASGTSALEEIKEIVKTIPSQLDVQNEEGTTPLHLLACWNDTELAEYFLSQGADPDIADKNGLTAVHYAVKMDRISMTALFIKYGADLNKADNKGWTPLFYAAADADMYQTELLLSNGARCDEWLQDKEKRTPVDIAIAAGSTKVADLIKAHIGLEDEIVEINQAAEKGNIAKLEQLLSAHPNLVNAQSSLRDPAITNASNKAVAELLLSKGAQINAPSFFGRTPLVEAAIDGRQDVVQILLQKGAPVNLRRIEWSALHAAAAFKHPAIAKILVEAGADIYRKDESGCTPLHAAASAGNRETAEMLIAKGGIIDVFIVTALGKMDKVKEYLQTDQGVLKSKRSGRNLLHWAVAGGSKEAAAFCISKGLDVNDPDEDGFLPLHTALSGGYADVVELLVAKGADVNAKLSKTPLIHFFLLGADADDAPMVKLLISKGADVNIRAEENEQTPLHFACSWSDKAIVEALLFCGADIEAQDKDGWTPLHHAACMDKKEAVELLLAKGAKVNSKDKEGRTPLAVANYSSGKGDAADVLIAHGGEK